MKSSSETSWANKEGVKEKQLAKNNPKRALLVVNNIKLWVKNIIAPTDRPVKTRQVAYVFATFSLSPTQPSAI